KHLAAVELADRKRPDRNSPARLRIEDFPAALAAGRRRRPDHHAPAACISTMDERDAGVAGPTTARRGEEEAGGIESGFPRGADGNQPAVLLPRRYAED